MNKEFNNRMPAKVIARQATYTNETGTFLSDVTIEMIKQDFCNEQEYARRTGHLYLLRNLLFNYTDNNPKHPAWPLYVTINDLIGCLLQYDINFDGSGRAYEVKDGKMRFIKI